MIGPFIVVSPRYELTNDRCLGSGGVPSSGTTIPVTQHVQLERITGGSESSGKKAAGQFRLNPVQFVDDTFRRFGSGRGFLFAYGFDAIDHGKG